MGVLAADALGGFRSQTNGAREESHQGSEVMGRFLPLQRAQVGVAALLLDRIANMANLLDGGASVVPEQIAEGIDLWETYLHGDRWESLSLLADPPVSSCSAAIGEARENHELAPVRMARLRTLLESYSSGLRNARAKLVLELRVEVLVDRTWVCFQERHRFSTPRGKLLPGTNEQTPRAVTSEQKVTRLLEEKVKQYLACGVTVRSHAREIRRVTASGASKTTVPWMSAAECVNDAGRLS
jgi:hypothetical protein